jgi:chromosome partitioning protein
MAVKIVSIFNLKGGVGKTTIAQSIAEFMAHAYNKKVLIIDMDSQANLTQALISPRVWSHREQSHQTIQQVFLDAAQKERVFNPLAAVSRNISNIKEGNDKTFHLIPSSWDIDEDDIVEALAQSGSFTGAESAKILGAALQPLLNDYDWAIIDCPPRFGLMTKNALAMSHYYILPIVPHSFAIRAVEKVSRKVANFTAAAGTGAKPLGVILNQYAKRTKHDQDTIASLSAGQKKSEHFPKLFNNYIPYAIDAVEATEPDAPLKTLKQKYGTLYETLEKLAKEIMDRARRMQ